MGLRFGEVSAPTCDSCGSSLAPCNCTTLHIPAGRKTTQETKSLYNCIEIPLFLFEWLVGEAEEARGLNEWKRNSIPKNNLEMAEKDEMIDICYKIKSDIQK